MCLILHDQQLLKALAARIHKKHSIHLGHFYQTMCPYFQGLEFTVCEKEPLNPAGKGLSRDQIQEGLQALLNAKAADSDIIDWVMVSFSQLLFLFQVACWKVCLLAVVKILSYYDVLKLYRKMLVKLTWRSHPIFVPWWPLFVWAPLTVSSSFSVCLQRTTFINWIFWAFSSPLINLNLCFCRDSTSGGFWAETACLSSPAFSWSQW